MTVDIDTCSSNYMAGDSRSAAWQSMWPQKACCWAAAMCICSSFTPTSSMCVIHTCTRRCQCIKGPDAALYETVLPVLQVSGRSTAHNRFGLSKSAACPRVTIPAGTLYIDLTDWFGMLFTRHITSCGPTSILPPPAILLMLLVLSVWCFFLLHACLHIWFLLGEGWGERESTCVSVGIN